MHSPAAEFYQAPFLRAVVTGPPTPTDSVHDSEVSRGRFKRRRTASSRTPSRATSPLERHDRNSDGRCRHDYRTQQRASSSSSIDAIPIPRKHRRRSEAEPDHTLRGRGRRRSESRSRSPMLQGEERASSRARKRSQPPSRSRVEQDLQVEPGEDVVRRSRSYPNLYQRECEQTQWNRGNVLMTAEGIRS